MKTLKNLAFAPLAIALLFQASITRADDQEQRISKPFTVLLNGIYKPVALGEGPKHNLGLTRVDLDDGSYSKVKIYPVSGLPGDKNKAIGTFYVQFAGDLCAYDLPEGAFTARFVGSDVEQLPETPLPGESWTWDGTFKLEILEATGIYQRFAGGHIHMVDILKFRAGDGTFLEDCFCHFHRKLVKP